MFNHGSDFTIKQHANRKYASPLYAFVRIGLVLDLWCFIITAFLSEPATKQDLFFKLVKALRTLVARGCSEERLTTGNPTADSHWGFGRWGGGGRQYFGGILKWKHFSNRGKRTIFRIRASLPLRTSLSTVCPPCFYTFVGLAAKLTAGESRLDSRACTGWCNSGNKSEWKGGCTEEA